MTKNLKKFKASFVAGIILASIFVLLASSFSVNAEKAGGRGTIIRMERTDHNNQTVNPSKPVSFTFKVTYELMPIIPGMEPILYLPYTTVQLSVMQGGDEPWITAALDYYTLQMEPGESHSQIVTLTVSVTPEAPYIKAHEIKIEAKAQQKGMWAESTHVVSVLVYPEFLYFVNAYSTEKQVQISPSGSPYKFPITLVNDASYEVKFYFEINNVPTGWAIAPPDTMTVFAKSKENAYFSIISPYEFGQHIETVSFEIDVYAEPYPTSGTAIYEKAKISTLPFTAANLGFSLVLTGAALFGIIFVIIALLVIFIIISFLRKSKKEKTVEKKK